MNVSLRELIGSFTLAKGAACSVAAHVGILSLAVALGWTGVTRQAARIPGKNTGMRVATSFAGPNATGTEGSDLGEPVVVMPKEARLANHHYVQRTTQELNQELAKVEVTDDGELPPPPPRPIERADDPVGPEAPGPTASTLKPGRRSAEPAQLGISHARSSSSMGNDGSAISAYFNNRPPIYPAIAIRDHLEGEVLLRVVVAANGLVERVEVVASSGHAVLDASAVTAVRTWRFLPAQENFQPVASVEVLPVRFRFPDPAG